jgi:sugar/nucleoside kinase (ribokinase family)
LSDALALWPRPERPYRTDVIGIGENSLDRVGVVESLARPGGKEPLVEYSVQPGGQVATAVLACSRLGLRCAYVGAVGNDADAEAVLAPLEAAGVDLSGIKRVGGARTRLAMILVERASGERSVHGFRDARLALEASDLSRESIERARVLLLDAGDPEAAIWAAKIARGTGTAVVLDADRADSGLEKLLDHVDFPIVSGAFAESLQGDAEASDATLRELVAHGARLAVVTLGARGAVGRAGDRVIASPAHPVSCMDSTGAGDAFRAGFIWALLQGQGAEQVLRAANAAAGINCRARGAQGGLANRAELEAFLHPNPTTAQADR